MQKKDITGSGEQEETETGEKASFLSAHTNSTGNREAEALVQTAAG